jgi:glutathione S-transferase
MLKLFIGNKNYSSWSMRPWVLMRQTGIAFQEVMLRFDSFDSGSTFKAGLKDITPVGKVPVLTDEGFAVWDTLAIAEFQKKTSGLLTPKRALGHAASAPKCTAVLPDCAALAP